MSRVANRSASEWFASLGNCRSGGGKWVVTVTPEGVPAGCAGQGAAGGLAAYVRET